MTQTALATLIVALICGSGTAQGVDRDASSKVVKKVVVSKNGTTRTYKKVIKDGRVVEESGDPGLIGEFGIDDLLRRAGKPGVGGDAKSGSTSSSRRVVMRDGKKIIDERSGDDLDGGKKDLRSLLEQSRGVPSPRAGRARVLSNELKRVLRPHDSEREDLEAELATLRAQAEALRKQIEALYR